MPMSNLCQGPLARLCRERHRSSVQGLLDPSFSSAAPADALLPLANHDSGPPREGHWVQPSKHGG